MARKGYSKLIWRSCIFLVSAVPLLLLSLSTVHAQTSPQLCKTTQLVLKDLKKYHYAPPDFNETTRRQIIKIFIESLDPEALFFLSSDELELELLVQAAKEDVFCDVIAKSASVYTKRLHHADSIATNLLSSPLNFNTPDTILFSLNQPAVLQPDAASLNNRITKILKFSVLTIMHEYEKDSTLHLIGSEAEEKARKSALKRFERRYIRQVADRAALEKYIAEKLWDAIAQRCDPHSNYFNPDNKAAFEKSLSANELSFGLVIAENNRSEIEIVKVIPGSPAWKTNDFNEGDIILGITAPTGKRIDIMGMSEDEIREVIESATSKQLQFAIRKKNNSEKKINLEQDKVESETNVLNGFLLKDAAGNIGLIQLPAFYTDFEGDGKLGCANDVAKEILKLLKENINGLILDLRNNGGGSLSEAMNLAGIFIDEGPLGIIKYAGNKPVLIRDFNRGTIYDGPLVVLINGLSASASEFLSEVLQDYKRAILVGGTTYGKGTGQNIVPVDSTEKTFKSGFLKVTDMKFYRLTNGTNQSQGVSPDIYLPDIYMKLDAYKEHSQPYHLLPDSVSKKVVYTANPGLPVIRLAQQSKMRIESNTQFRRIERMADSLALLFNKEYKIALNKKSFNRYLEMINNFGHSMESLSAYESPSFEVANNQYLDKILVLDSNKKNRNEKEIKDIKSDAALEEAFLILKDHINNNSK